MLAALIALIRNVPLKSKILFHSKTSLQIFYKERYTAGYFVIGPRSRHPGSRQCKTSFSWNYLSVAPHAEPQADGASAGLSAAPQADGASAGLSAAAQAVPQAEETPVSSFQPDKFESAIFITSCFVF